MKEDIRFFNDFRIRTERKWWNPLTWFNRDVLAIEMNHVTGLDTMNVISFEKPDETNAIMDEINITSIGDSRRDSSIGPGPFFIYKKMVVMSTSELNQMAEWIRDHGKNGFYITNHDSDTRKLVVPTSNEGRMLRMKICSNS